VAYINKVVLEFSFPPHEKNSALSKAKKIFYNIAIEKIDEILGAEDNNIFIEKLEVDIGFATEDDFAEKFSAGLLKAIPASFFRERNITETKFIATNEKENLSVDEMIFFLDHGYWQWRVQKENEQQIIKLLKNFFNKAELVSSLFKSISKHFEAVKRLHYLISNDKILQQQFFKTLLLIHPYLKEIKSFIEKIYLNVDEKNVGAAFIQNLYQRTSIDSPIEFKKFTIEFLEKSFIKENFSEELFASFKKIITVLKKEHIDTTEKIIPSLEKLLLQFDKLNETTIFEANKKENIPFFINEEESKIGIANAGLVLIHPYLPFLFKELEWIDNTQNFIDKTAQQKAVLFLQFLINNKNKQQEHLLVLNKILCGWPVEMPLKINHQFTVAEKKAGEEMLDSFIEHWTILKNTSRKGLIESFIKRKGLVQKTNSDFVVQVEKNSIDVLLDSLPFGIQTIKLPWNEYIIFTEWTF